MSSSGEDQSEINSERASTNARSVEIESRCIYPNERRERNQIYTLLNISNSVNEEEERFLECVSATGWEDAVQGWNKMPPFAYHQLQKRASKVKTSETVNGCLYCADLMQGVEKGLEQEAKTVDQLKSDFRSITYTATNSIPEKKQTLLYSNPVAISPATDDAKKESYGKICCSQTFQGEKRKMTLKEAQASLSERRVFVMKENPLFQAEKKTVPIKEYSIIPPGNSKSLEVLKCKDTKNHESSSSSSLCNQMASEATAKPTLVLPPLKDVALKNTLDPSPRKKQSTLSQASDKPLSETAFFTHALKTKEQNCEKGMSAMYNALKEQIRMHEIASLVPRLSKTSFISRNLDRCCWHYSDLPDRKIGTVSNSIAMRRHSNSNGAHFLHTKAAQASKARGTQEPYTRSRSHIGTKQHQESKAQEIPLLSGLFPSLTEEGWGRATPFKCCKISPKSKKPRLSKIVSSISQHQMTAGLQKNEAWVAQLARDQRRVKDYKLTKKETVSSTKEMRVSNVKPYNFVPRMTSNGEGERMRGKLDSIQTFLGEKRTLPIKEYEIKYSQPHSASQVFRYKEISLPKVIRDHPSSRSSYITLNAFLVFRADGNGGINLHLEPLSNNEATAIGRMEQESRTLTQNEPRRRATQKVKQKNGKKAHGRTNTMKRQIHKSRYHSLICL